MSSGTQTGNVIRSAVEYFGSFHGYGSELTPVAPIAFEQTRKSAGFTEVERDAGGFVAVLRKVGVTRLPDPPVSHGLGSARPPGTDLVFEAVFDPRIGEHSVGAEIDYGATRFAGTFFAGSVEEDGGHAALRLYRRAVVFAEVYPRDSAGRLTTAIHFAADAFPRIECFDEGGSPLPLADRYVGTRDVGAEARTKAEELRRRAKQNIGEKQYPTAIDDLDSALALVDGDKQDATDSPLASVLCNLGTAWLSLKDLTRAEFFAACGLELHSRQENVRGVGVGTLTLALAFQLGNSATCAAECHRQAARFFLKAGDTQSRRFALDQLHAIESSRANGTE